MDPELAQLDQNFCPLSRIIGFVKLGGHYDCDGNLGGQQVPLMLCHIRVQVYMLTILAFSSS